MCNRKTWILHVIFSYISTRRLRNDGMRCSEAAKGNAPMVHRVERLLLRPSPYRSDRGWIPACGSLLHFFPTLSHTFLSYSKNKNKNLQKVQQKKAQSRAERYHDMPAFSLELKAQDGHIQMLMRRHSDVRGLAQTSHRAPHLQMMERLYLIRTSEMVNTTLS